MMEKLLKKFKSNKISSSNKLISPKMELDIEHITINANLDENLKKINSIFKNSFDINIRNFTIEKNMKQAFIVNVEGISDKTIINENILGTLMQDILKIPTNYEINIKSIKEYAMSVSNVKSLNSFVDVVDGILSGNTVLFLDGDTSALEITTRAWEHRNVEAPQTENVVRGPHEGFTETLRTNTALLRLRIKSPNLIIEALKIGSRTRTNICIAYIDNLADSKIVEEVRRRLNSIDIDAVIGSGYIEDFIEDAPLSLFPTVGNVETPDKLAAKLLEGRIGIIVDGSPIVLTVPYLFVESFQVTEDYYSRAFFASQVRLLRFLAFHLTIYLPAIYVALSSYNPGILPDRLLLTMRVTREGIPFPPPVEAILMLVIFEILREAGVRMPRPIGQAVSIVGALIMGEVAVNAGIVSPLMVIIVASTGILSFLITPLNDAIGTIRLPIVIMASIFGLYGVFWSYVLTLIHVASIRSFGVPYMSPFMPFNFKDLKDTVIRVPLWAMKTRPTAIMGKETNRVADSANPTPYKNKDGDITK